ncbi:hypothetical protein EG68_00551 [Paragonimus skrjabini miyazakii]|uniref:Uncharacterized protein n=1 Tax=Paragonimus skrjabini miyazakii TaxID=59628 RepID=A0A8S9Z8J7_9TREM|nr:hypothetical protein EG68_00551 [Paragonimus skrjabini miyazakii]
MVELHANAMTATHVLTLYLLLGLCVANGVILSTINVTKRHKPRDVNLSDDQYLRISFGENFFFGDEFSIIKKANYYNRRTQKLRFDMRKLAKMSDSLFLTDLHFYYPGCEEVNCSKRSRIVKLQLRQIGRSKCGVKGPDYVQLSKQRMTRCECGWAVFNIPMSKRIFSRKCIVKNFNMRIFVKADNGKWNPMNSTAHLEHLYGAGFYPFIAAYHIDTSKRFGIEDQPTTVEDEGVK